MLLAGARVSAQDAFFERWKELAGRQPQGVKFVITTPKTEFFFGEVIPLELRFTSTQPRAFLTDSRLQDRVGRMNYTEEFVAAPASLSEDPLQGLQGGQGGMGGLSGGPVLLSEKPFAFERVLNEWVRFRKPGEYRVYVVSRRVGQVGDPEQQEALAAAQTPIHRGGVKPPAVAATRALGDDVHPVTSVSGRREHGPKLLIST